MLDFGDDAIILSSNVVKSKGFLGLFKKKSVEVVAGFDEPVSRNRRNSSSNLFHCTAERVDNTSVELKKEMTEMKKMLKDMQQAATHSRFPDEVKPLLTILKNRDCLQISSLSWVRIFTIG